ncbi:F-box family protein [Trifolium pratense]|uniref:F-box family protein n=1 Tax=Trifolium pratense TaxID=57577 RepID=A0A2K3NSX7_TRIPR|nr:F-box family protein [Trifolium pratense]
MSDSNEESSMILQNMKKRKQCDNQNDDRLSDLPDCVLLHILSFLNTKQVVQTCILSKRWTHLWKRISTLFLHSSNFSTLKCFAKYASKILTLRDTSTALHAFDLDRWGDIELQLFKKVLKCVSSQNTHLKELGISLHGDTSLVMSCVSSCHALTSLKLSLSPRESLTLTSTTLQILSLLPNLLEVKHHSLCNLKSLDVVLIPLYDGSLSQSIKDDMLKKAAAKYHKEVAKFSKAFKARLEPPVIPDGIVDFLRQNSPLAEVNISSDFPHVLNLKQVAESIKGAKIVKYRSRYAAPASSSIAPPSATAHASVAVSASAVPPNLHLYCGEKNEMVYWISLGTVVCNLLK